MKILIANPPAYLWDSSRHFIQAGSRWSFTLNIPKGDTHEHYLPYPFYLGYSSALLKRDTNSSVKAIDFCALDQDEEDFVSAVELHSPDMLVMEVPTISFPLITSLLSRIKEKVGCKIAVAGSHATALAEDILRSHPPIDFCLIGEYEFTLKDLVEELSKNDSLGGLVSMPGVAFRKGDEIVVNHRRELIDLDLLPFPDRDDLPPISYHDFELAGKPCIQMLSSRGCPMNCSFCIERQVIFCSPRYRERKAVNIVEEMKFVKEKYGARQVYFDDETMTIDKKHLHSICETILEEKLDLPWACMGDVTLGMENLALMAKSGCVGLKFGVETPNRRILKEIGKGFIELDKARKLVDACRRIGIWSHATFMIGLPGERKEDVHKTIKFALKLKPDGMQFSIATPFPGTPFFNLAQSKGWLKILDWTQFDGAHRAVVSYPELSSEEIEGLYRMALGEYKKLQLSRRSLGMSTLLRTVRTKGIYYSLHRGASILGAKVSMKFK